MKGSFFLITFLLVLLMPSLAGCASGGSKVHVRPSASPEVDAGHTLSSDAGSLPRDAGREVAVTDAYVPRVDATPDVTSRDAGTVTHDAYVAPPDPGEHLLRISLAPSVRARCPSGWRTRLWLTDPPVESTRGLDLELHIPDLTYWGPWSSITLWCDELAPQWYVWSASDGNAMGSGAFSELSLDGFDLRNSTRLCDDPLAPSGGSRPILMWDADRHGSCPP